MDETNKTVSLEGTAYERLLEEKIKDERLRELVKKKYDEEAAAFSQAAKDFCPSDDHAYWAKKSCNKCFGRGIIGTQYIFSTDSPAKVIKNEDTGKSSYENGFSLEAKCNCTTKNYKKWLTLFRRWYNALKAQTEVDNETKTA